MSRSESARSAEAAGHPEVFHDSVADVGSASMTPDARSLDRLGRTDSGRGAHAHGYGAINDGAADRPADLTAPSPRPPLSVRTNSSGDLRGGAADVDANGATPTPGQREPSAPLCEVLHIRTPARAEAVPYLVYFAEVAEATTMVVVSERTRKTDVEAQAMADIQRSLQESLREFVDFLIVKARTNTSILPFLSFFPGLVHFIYVDRSRDMASACARRWHTCATMPSLLTAAVRRARSLRRR